jgi:hypothetical protein
LTLLASLAFESALSFNIGGDLLPHVGFAFDLTMSGFSDSLGRTVGYAFAADSQGAKQTVGMVFGIASVGGFDPGLRHHRSDPHGLSYCFNHMVTQSENP